MGVGVCVWGGGVMITWQGNGAWMEGAVHFQFEGMRELCLEAIHDRVCQCVGSWMSFGRSSHVLDC